MQTIASDARARLDQLAKPQGSLGRLEDLAVRLCETQVTSAPLTAPRTLLVFAGDHGVVEAGVGIWPSAVTTAMLDVIDKRRAACSAFAASTNTALVLIDVGSRAPKRAESEVYQDRRVAMGTANLAEGAAMTAAQFQAAWDVGATAMRQAVAAGARVVAVGEIGIGNTTPAACLISLLTNAPSATLVGPGAGATAESLARKRAVVADAVERAKALMVLDPIAAMASVCGYEIAAMAGAIATSSQLNVTLVLDGVVTAAAALVARQRVPTACDTAIAAHVGAEPAHAVALAKLGLTPVLDWQLRLGEGTGALLVMPLLDAAAALLRDVATLEDVLSGAS
jgi:nicotinate-nucleotide--dimethylbenzimidazole phosphoribosyltransferase